MTEPTFCNPLADGPALALDALLALGTADGGAGLLPQLLHGRPKVVIVEWNGDLQNEPDSFDPDRHDGRISVLQPGDPEAQLPPNVLGIRLNWWQAAAFWLINRRHRRTYAAGLLFPLLHSAAFDAWGDNRQLQGRYFSTDPRIDPPNQAWPERPYGLASFSDEETWCQRSIGQLGPQRQWAPRLAIPSPAKAIGSARLGRLGQQSRAARRRPV